MNLQIGIIRILGLVIYFRRQLLLFSRHLVLQLFCRKLLGSLEGQYGRRKFLGNPLLRCAVLFSG